MDASDIWTLVAAAIGMVTGIGGLCVSVFAESRARKSDQRAAAADARAAAADQRAIAAAEQAELDRQRSFWTEAVMAAQSLVAVNVITQDFHPRVERLRTAFTELVDGLPDGQYRGLREWLGSEHMRLALALDCALVSLNGRPRTMENMERAHERAHASATAILSNLRYFRGKPPSQECDEEMAMLTRTADADCARMTAELGRDAGNG